MATSAASLSDQELSALRDNLVKIALQAGEMITSATARAEESSTNGSTNTGLSTKKNSADLVTETDKAVEDFISSTLRMQTR